MKSLRGIMKLFLYIKKSLLYFVILIILSMITSLLNLLPIQIFGTLVNILANASNNDSNLWLLLIGKKPYILIMLLSVILLLGGLAEQLYGYSVTKFNFTLIRELREDVYRWILKTFQPFRSNLKEGDLIARLTGDVEAVTRALAGPLNGLVTNIFELCWAIIIMGLWNIKLALASVVIIPPLFVLTNWFTQNSRNLAKQQRESQGELTNFLTNTLFNIPVIRAFESEETEILKFKPYNDKIMNTIKKAAKLTAKYWFGVKLLNILGIAIVLILVYFLVLEQKYLNLNLVH